MADCESLSFQFSNCSLEAGCDEAGRGCLAGPVVAAAVILREGFSHSKLRDSKQMSVADRQTLRNIIEQESLAWSVSVVEHTTIDRINILQASVLAMNQALERLEIKPDFIAVDGHYFHTGLNIPFACCVKGDSRFLNIAAASVLAKTHRDEIMENLHRDFPVYGWNSNKGYPTVSHRNAIRIHGASPYHRQSFRLLEEAELF